MGSSVARGESADGRAGRRVTASAGPAHPSPGTPAEEATSTRCARGRCRAGRWCSGLLVLGPALGRGLRPQLRHGVRARPELLVEPARAGRRAAARGAAGRGHDRRSRPSSRRSCCRSSSCSAALVAAGAGAARLVPDRPRCGPAGGRHLACGTPTSPNAWCSGTGGCCWRTGRCPGWWQRSAAGAGSPVACRRGGPAGGLRADPTGGLLGLAVLLVGGWGRVPRRAPACCGPRRMAAAERGVVAAGPAARVGRQDRRGVGGGLRRPRRAARRRAADVARAGRGVERSVVPDSRRHALAVGGAAADRSVWQRRCRLLFRAGPAAGGRAGSARRPRAGACAARRAPGDP